MTNEQDKSTGPSWMVGLGRFTTRERMERTSKPEAEYTGRPSPDGAVKGRDGRSEGRAFVSAYDGLDEPTDGGKTRSGI
jgi:hypothetical protein